MHWTELVCIYLHVNLREDRYFRWCFMCGWERCWWK